MFSVRAAPFNSQPRQLYGGWTLADAGNDVWSLKKWAQMAKKYATGIDDRQRANAILAAYRAFGRTNPAGARALRAQLARRSREAGRDVFRPPMRSNEKRAIWNAFLNQVPVGMPTRTQRLAFKTMMGGPYPNREFMNFWNTLGVPYLPHDPNAGNADGYFGALRDQAEMDRSRQAWLNAYRQALNLQPGQRIPRDQQAYDFMMNAIAAAVPAAAAAAAPAAAAAAAAAAAPAGPGVPNPNWGILANAAQANAAMAAANRNPPPMDDDVD